MENPWVYAESLLEYQLKSLRQATGDVTQVHAVDECLGLSKEFSRIVKEIRELLTMRGSTRQGTDERSNQVLDILSKYKTETARTKLDGLDEKLKVAKTIVKDQVRTILMKSKPDCGQAPRQYLENEIISLQANFMDIMWLTDQVSAARKEMEVIDDLEKLVHFLRLTDREDNSVCSRHAAGYNVRTVSPGGAANVDHHGHMEEFLANDMEEWNSIFSSDIFKANSNNHCLSPTCDQSPRAGSRDVPGLSGHPEAAYFRDSLSPDTESMNAWYSSVDGEVNPPRDQHCHDYTPRAQPNDVLSRNAHTRPGTFSQNTDAVDLYPHVYDMQQPRSSVPAGQGASPVSGGDRLRDYPGDTHNHERNPVYPWSTQTDRGDTHRNVRMMVQPPFEYSCPATVSCNMPNDINVQEKKYGAVSRLLDKSRALTEAALNENYEIYGSYHKGNRDMNRSIDGNRVVNGPSLNRNHGMNKPFEKNGPSLNGNCKTNGEHPNRTCEMNRSMLNDNSGLNGPVLNDNRDMNGPVGLLNDNRVMNGPMFNDNRDMNGPLFTDNRDMNGPVLTNNRDMNRSILNVNRETHGSPLNRNHQTYRSGLPGNREILESECYDFSHCCQGAVSNTDTDFSLNLDLVRTKDENTLHGQTNVPLKECINRTGDAVHSPGIGNISVTEQTPAVSSGSQGFVPSDRDRDILPPEDSSPWILVRRPNRHRGRTKSPGLGTDGLRSSFKPRRACFPARKHNGRKCCYTGRFEPLMRESEVLQSAFNCNSKNSEPQRISTSDQTDPPHTENLHKPVSGVPNRRDLMKQTVSERDIPDFVLVNELMQDLPVFAACAFFAVLFWCGVTYFSDGFQPGCRIHRFYEGRSPNGLGLDLLAKHMLNYRHYGAPPM